MRIFTRNSVRSQQPKSNERDRHVPVGHVVGLEHDLRHALPDRIATCLVGTLHVCDLRQALQALTETLKVTNMMCGLRSRPARFVMTFFFCVDEAMYFITSAKCDVH